MTYCKCGCFAVASLCHPATGVCASDPKSWCTAHGHHRAVPLLNFRAWGHASTLYCSCRQIWCVASQEEAAADLLATAVSDGDEGGEEEGDAGPSGDRPPVYRADEMHEKLVTVPAHSTKALSMGSSTLSAAYAYTEPGLFVSGLTVGSLPGSVAELQTARTQEDIMREELGWEETLVVAGISDEQAAFPVDFESRPEQFV